MSYLEDFEKTLGGEMPSERAAVLPGSLSVPAGYQGTGRKVEKGTFQRGVPDLSEYGWDFRILCRSCAAIRGEKACLRAKLDGGIAMGAFRAGDGQVREAEGTECV